MELITHILEEKRSGAKIVRNFFLYGKKEDTLKQSQSYFTKSQKKEAKANYEISLKQNIMHQERRKELVEHVVKQPLPNWNIKLGFI
jgi:hypothetical protein